MSGSLLNSDPFSWLSHLGNHKTRCSNIFLTLHHLSADYTGVDSFGYMSQGRTHQKLSMTLECVYILDILKVCVYIGKTTEVQGGECRLRGLPISFTRRMENSSSDLARKHST